MNLEVKCRNCAFVKLVGCYQKFDRPMSPTASGHALISVCVKIFSLVVLPLKRLPRVLAVHGVLCEFVC